MVSVVHKKPGAVAPNLTDYDAARAAFSWEGARRELEGLPGGAGLNIAHEAVDRHDGGGRADHVALRWRSRHDQVVDVTYGELARRTNRFANVLRELGIAPGERVFTLAGRILELYVAALGTLKHRSVLCPLFSAFGPEPIRQRLEIGSGAALVTTTRLYHRKVEPIRDRLPALRHVLLVDGAASGEALPGTLALDALMASASDAFTIEPTDPEDPALLHFTSGTTGTPKGAIHVHDAVVAHRETARVALDLHPDDVFWCTADPGWVTGTSYGIVAPLTLGATMVVDEGEFEAERWYRILAEHDVSVWYTAPTAVRMMMRSGAAAARAHRLPALRFIASVGEPLDPAAVRWGEEAFGLPIHDNWWQTETGGIMVANFAATDIRPGSMGRPLPGIDAAILRRDARGELVLDDDGDGEPVLATDGEQGELALRASWPSMFRGYLGQEDRYRRCFAGGWYRSGDLAQRDEDGWFWFVGRADDVIKSAGHLIGPFEVESVLLGHPSVAQAGVIGVPDPIAGEAVKAYVSLRNGAEPGEGLRRELLAFARSRLGAAVAPRQVEFRETLPVTRSGKVMRRVLRARELGLPEGDVSTLEGGA